MSMQPPLKGGCYWLWSNVSLIISQALAVHWRKEQVYPHIKGGQGRAVVSSPPRGSRDKKAERRSKLGLWRRAGASLCQESPYLDALCKRPTLWAARWGGCKGRMLRRGRRWPWASCDCMWVRDWGGGKEELRDRERLRDRQREEGGQTPKIQLLSAGKCSLHIEGHPFLLLCSSRDWCTRCPWPGLLW